MRLRADDLDLPAQRGARLLAARHLREALEELDRLEREGGEEALHDFRVALRRLRSLLRALRPWLGAAVRRRHARRLRAIARATTPARDAEVQLAWIARERVAAGPREVPGIAWLERRLAARSGEEYRARTKAAAGRYRRLARRMARRLSGGEEAEPGPRLGPALAELVRAHAAALGAALDAVGGPADVDQAHEARIDAKRLRYLLEPLRGCGRADAEAAVGRLRELQEILGELHDAHVALDVVGEALAGAAAERARRAHAALVAGEGAGGALLLAGRGPLARGLVALDLRALERARAAHARLRGEWLSSARVELEGAVETVARALEAGSASSPPRRRLLLSRLPAELAAAPADELRAQDDLAVRRRPVGGAPGWHVDEVAGLRLVLAEGPAEADGRGVPRMLRGAVVRDVSEERAYRDRALASRQRRAQAPRQAEPEGPAPPAGGDPSGARAEAEPSPAGPEVGGGEETDPSRVTPP